MEPMAEFIFFHVGSSQIKTQPAMLGPFPAFFGGRAHQVSQSQFAAISTCVSQAQAAMDNDDTDIEAFHFPEVQSV